MLRTIVKHTFIYTLSLISCSLFIDDASAQIVPDNTLPISSTVDSGCSICQIDGGIIRSNNLFHSFSEFSIPKDGQAIFNNSLAIENIFTRVTGTSVSNIDGVIKANGIANLFLINPNGIVFGANASLNLGGSFVVSTANSIKFADNSVFSAIVAESTPLLTVSIPIGLSFSNNPKGINIQGEGHRLSSQEFFRPIYNPNNPNIVALPQNPSNPLIPVNNNPGLQLNPGQTFALIGGDININGGVINALSGRVELGSVKAGEVSIKPTLGGLSFGYENVSSSGDIKLQNRALVDASGKLPNSLFLLGDTSNLVNPLQLQAGNIKFQARNIEVLDASTVLLQNYGFLTDGSININATESLKIVGASQDGAIRSGFISENFGLGRVGNIDVVAPQLSVLTAGAIVTKTFGISDGSPININSELIQISGLSPTNPANISTIGAVTIGEGKAGDVAVSTKGLIISNSGALSSSNFVGRGAGGNLTVNADIIELIDFNQSAIPASITATNLGFGNAGSLVLNTRTLNLRDGAAISTASFGRGNAGDITINASESIKMSGLLETGKNTTIASSVTPPPLGIRTLFQLPENPTGSSGNITINTANLELADTSTINVQNVATGRAGTLQINAESVRLNTQSSFLATTQIGEGGDIIVKAKDIQLRRGSGITTDAKSQGIGGNITLDTNTLVALENSDITANAIDDRGGRVVINAQAIFGTQYQTQLTPNSDITATSQRGVDFSGTVDINTLNVDPNLGLIELPQTIAEGNNKIEATCSTSSDNKFAITGRGGISQSPHDAFTGVQSLVNTVDLVANNQPIQKKLQVNSDVKTQPEHLEAQGWEINKGKIRLVADAVNVASKNTNSVCMNN